MPDMSAFEELEQDICPKDGGRLIDHAGITTGYDKDFDCEIVAWRARCEYCGEVYKWVGYEKG